MKAVISPSGAGKSHFLKNNTELIDGDSARSGEVYMTVQPRGAKAIRIYDGDTMPSIIGVYRVLTHRFGSQWWQNEEHLVPKASLMARVFRSLLPMSRAFVMTAEIAPAFIPGFSVVFVIPDAETLVANTQIRGPVAGQPVFVKETAEREVRKYRSLAEYANAPVYLGFEAAFSTLISEDWHANTVKFLSSRVVVKGGVK